MTPTSGRSPAATGQASPGTVLAPEDRPGDSPHNFRTLEQHVLSRIVLDPVAGCWIWTARCDRQGYGHLRIFRAGRKRSLIAHRVSYEAFIGPIPDGLTIDHLCMRKLCVNPAHLEPVTRVENIRRAMAAGLVGPRITTRVARTSRTHCAKGHEFDEANTYVNPAGYQRCRRCIRARDGRLPLSSGALTST